MPLFTRVLSPLDFSEPSEAAFRVALAFAKQEGASLRLLHVVEPILVPADFAMGPVTPAEFEQQLEVQAKQNLEAAARRAREAGLAVETEMRRGKPFDQIVACGRERGCDLIILGTHGLTGLTHILMGSTAEKVVRKAASAVLTIKAHPPKT